MHPAELERVVDHHLKRLPALRAPQTLLPRVMQSVRQLTARRPISWFDWPLAWQVLSSAAVVLLIAGAAWTWPAAKATFAGVSAPVAGASDRVADFARGTAAVAGALGSIWQSLLGPVTSSLLVFLALLAAACVLGATALQQLSFGETSRL